MAAGRRWVTGTSSSPSEVCGFPGVFAPRPPPVGRADAAVVPPAYDQHREWRLAGEGLVEAVVPRGVHPAGHGRPAPFSARSRTSSGICPGRLVRGGARQRRAARAGRGSGVGGRPDEARPATRSGARRAASARSGSSPSARPARPGRRWGDRPPGGPPAAPAPDQCRRGARWPKAGSRTTAPAVPGSRSSVRRATAADRPRPGTATMRTSPSAGLIGFRGSRRSSAQP